jgi:menaquinone-dependent protoporphyrinogen oxidase
MDGKVLVAYGSKYGATKEIAEKIGETLNGAGVQTDVISAGDLKDISAYRAFVLGSAAYIGGWRKEVTNLLQKNERILSERPVWIFSSGPTSGEDAAAELKGWQYPKLLETTINKINPRDIAIFHGKIDPENGNFLEKWMLKRVKSGIGDFRRWDLITAWALKIAAELK